MSLDNRHTVVGKHNSVISIAKYAPEVLNLEWDFSEWTDLDTAPATVGARTFTTRAGSTGAAPTLSVPAITGQKVTATLSAGDAGHKATIKFTVTMADGQVKAMWVDVDVLADPDPATAVLQVQSGKVDGRYIIVGNAGGVIPALVKGDDETFKVSWDLSQWNRESGATASSATAAVFTDPGANAPTLSGVAASGQVVSGTLAAGLPAWEGGDYGVLSSNVTMSNGEIKRVFLAIKID